MSKASTRTPVSTQKTPKRRKCTDPVEVSCRIRPLAGAKCIEQISETAVKLCAPTGSHGYKSNPVSLFYTFNNIFSEEDSQKAVFDKLALPLVEDLIQGKNSLLFAYGVTCSGKTHTMIGQANNPGILPRCLDVVFNSIGENQARPYIFLPDDANGMKIQPEYQAALMKNQIERQKRQEERLKRKEGRPDSPDTKLDEIRIPDSTKLDSVNEDSAYAVFISYIEVYNNYIFDLLEDEQVNEYGHTTLPESKKVGEDSKRKVMFVKDVVEIEVKSTEEACTQVWKGQERRRKAATILNDRSSRSHSVFNIRLVQAPYDEEGKQILLNKEMITISQLSLVDLAGSERPSKTNATGDMLKEAGNINNSLMTLHACLETLRANQLGGRATKIVPYRESKLTLLFKNFFEGAGKVRMVVCINPRSEDFDENVHVMKFAELTQDVQVARGQEVQFDENVLQPGRRKHNLLYKRVSGGPTEQQPLADITNRNSFGFNLPAVPPAFCMPPFPSWGAQDGSSEDKLQAVLAALHERQKMKKDALSDFEKRKQRMRAVLVQMEKENDELRLKTSQGTDEMTACQAELLELRSEVAKLEKDNLKQRREIDKLKKANALYSLERRQVLEEKKRTDERIKKEIEKRDNMRKTFKGVVGREKEKWEKNTEQMIRRVDLRAAQQESKLRQVLEIVGGNPDLVPQMPNIQAPRFDDIVLPSSTDTASSDTSSSPSRDQYNYTLPFKPTRDLLDSPVDSKLGILSPANSKPGILSPASSKPGILSPASSKPGILSPANSKPGILSPASSKPGILSPACSTRGSKAPSVAGSKAPSTSKASSVAGSKAGSAKSPFAGGIRVLPPGPVPSLSPAKKSPAVKDTPAVPRLNVATPSSSIQPVISKPKVGKKSSKSPHPVQLPAMECHISVDDRPEIPLKARMPKNLDNACKWLNHKPAENLDEANLLKPNLENKRTVPIPEVDDFDDQTSKYLLHHQEQDSMGEIRTHFIKGDIKISRGGGRCVEFTDIETSSKKPSAKDILAPGQQSVYPPPHTDSGDWTDTETRCAVGVGIPTAKTKPPTVTR